MPTIYYTSESNSLLVYPDVGQPTQVSGITELIVCGSLQQIIGFSGSVQFVTYPMQQTAVYYTSSLGLLAEIEEASASLANLTIRYIAENATDSTTYTVSSSAYFASGSGSSAYTINPVQADLEYTFTVTGDKAYTTQITIIDNSAPPSYRGLGGAIIANVESSNTPAVVAVSLANYGYYTAYLSVINE